MTGMYLTCPRCEGSGYQHLFGPLYRFPCRACDGTGEKPRLAWRIFQAIRHGAAPREGY